MPLVAGVDCYPPKGDHACRHPDTIEQTARDTEAFVDALGLDTVDLLATRFL
ncbi:hypothetical protein GCM10017788_61050 [Amycolatopsis acidiphila]|nr:hypothetical protein GCM10017788_61050 [Amycolatopsis acidiphila]